MFIHFDMIDIEHENYDSSIKETGKELNYTKINISQIKIDGDKNK